MGRNSKKHTAPKVHTFAEWISLGYRIRKGAKSKQRNKLNVPLFDATQVWKPDQMDEDHERELDDIHELSWYGSD